MRYILKSAKTIILALIVMAMLIGQLELFGNTYAQELEKIGDQDIYGDLYNKDIQNEATSPTVMNTGNPEVLTKEPVIEKEDITRVNQKEVKSLRTENSKTYQLRQGQYVTDFYFDPIHKKVKNQFVEIDNDLEEKKGWFRRTPFYENKDGLYDFQVDDGKVTLKDSDQGTLTLLPSGSLTNYAVKKNVILYSEVYKNMDLEYRVDANKIQQNIYINGKLDIQNYHFEIAKTDFDVKQNEDGAIVFSQKGKEMYTLIAPYLIDKDGNRNQESTYSYQKKANGNIEITLNLSQTWLQEETRVYPITARGHVRVGNVDVLDLESSYIRSGRPDRTSQYSDLFVGYDDDFYGGAGSNIKKARAFIYFKMPSIGSNQRIESATLKLYKEQDLAIANELNHINVYNTNYVDPSSVTWNNQPASSAKQLVSTKKFTKPKGWKEFDITKHVQDLNAGKKKTLVLQVTDESSQYNANIFNTESTGRLPKVEITHGDDYDINPGLDINQFDSELRVYAKNGQYFEAISMDGIAKPNSNVNFNLYAKVNETDFQFVKTQSAKEKSSPYFIDPIYITNPIDGVQKYIKDKVNYTTTYLRIGEIPQYDTFYEYRMKVVNGSTTSKELITDGFIIYKVKLGDSLKSIASHYGLKIDEIKKDNNTTTNKIKEGDVLFLRFAKNNPKVPQDVYRPPLKISSYEAKYVYRGPSCYGSCSVADPVNTSIGNFYHESTDFTITDFDELSLTRVYNSYGEDNASIFGTNFSSNFEQYVTYDKDDNMLFFRGDGKIVKITKQGGQYQPRAVDKIDVSVTAGKVSIYDQRTELTYVFDDYGTLTTIKTKTGFTSTINYDEYGWIKSVQLGDKQATFEYNDYHLVSRMTLPNGSAIQYRYNNKRQLIEVSDPVGKLEKYAYDNNGKIKNITDKNGHVLANNTYTGKGIVTSQIDANGNQVKFSYDGLTTSITYNNQETETYTLDDNLKVTKITKGDGTSRSYTYDTAGKMISETNEDGDKTTYAYNSAGYLTLQTRADGTTEKYTYDAKGNVTSKTAANGKVETYQYDSNNNLIYKDSESVQGTRYEYNTKNLVTKETNVFGVWKKYEYSGNLITKISHSNGLVESFVYDVMGNVIKESDSKGRSTAYVFDNVNRVIKKTDSYGKSESFRYDGNGNIIEYIDKLGGKTVSTYDKNNNLLTTSKGTLKTSSTYDYHNRVLSETDEQGLTTSYVYDRKGQKIKEVDAYGHTTTYTYDSVGRTLQTKDGKGNITTNTFDGDNLSKSTDARGQVTAYEYNVFNQITKITLPSGKTQKTDYDARGNVIKTENERGLSNTKEYDAYDRVIKETNEQGIVITNTYNEYGQLVKTTEGLKITTYAYDVYGNQIKETDAFNNSQTSTYDLLNRLVEETDELGHKTQHVYNANDDEIETIDALGHSEKKVYDVNGTLLQEIDKLGHATSYKYNSLGYVIEGTDAYQNVTKFTYDQYGQTLKTYLNDVLVENNTYDDYGRLTKQEKVNEITLTEYDTFDQVTKTTNETTGLITTNTYDQVGNLIKVSDNGGKTMSYEFDDFNQQIKSTDAYGRVSTKTYNQHGQVVETINETHEKTTQAYDQYGNVIKTVDHLGSTTTSTYDILNRKLTETRDDQKTLTYTYDAKGQIIATHDSFTNKDELMTYDALGRVIDTTDYLGNVSKTAYDAKGQVIKTIDALGNITTKQYDLYGNVTKETNALGHSHQTQYNAFGSVIKEVDERGFSQTYRYNEKLQVTEVTDKLGNVATFTYNDQGYVEKSTNQNGHITTYTYDIYGQTTQEVDPNGNIKTYEYDLLGNPMKTSEPHKTTVQTYDKLGRLISTKENNKVKITNQYNDVNQLIQTTNALNNVTTYEYDMYGNTTKETFVDHVVENHYDLNSQLVKKIENKTKTTTYDYDVLGREIKQTENDQVMLAQTYNAVGSVIEKTEKGVTTQYTYDALGQQTQQKYPSVEKSNEFKTIVSIQYDESGHPVEFKDIENNVLKRAYDANGNIMSEINTNGHTTKYEYDSLSNLIKVQTPLERVVKYDYDGNNNLLKRTLNNKEATYTYDDNNNLIQEVSEYGFKENYTYDTDGHMTSLTKNDGQKIHYTYDAMGRKLSEGSRQFEYDAYDNITKASDNKTTIEYTYDAFNNITSVNDANGNVIQYQWDSHGNRTELKYKNNTVRYTYNQYQKIDKVMKNGKDYASYTYDARGNTKTFVRNSLTTSYTYDELNRRVQYTNTKGNKTLSTYQYAYDGQNNIISETINGHKNTYTYNESDELKTSSKTINQKIVNTEYVYDLFGNKVETSDQGQGKVYHYNDKNQLTSINEKGVGITDIYYDENGNMVDIQYAGGDKEHYTYDEFDQVTELKTNQDSVWTYAYDAEGDRIYESNVVKAERLVNKHVSYQEDWYEYLQSLDFTEVQELLEDKNADETFDALKSQIKYRDDNQGLCTGKIAKEKQSYKKTKTSTYALDKTVENALILSSGDDFNIYGEERISTETDKERLTYISSLNESVIATVNSKDSQDIMTSVEYTDAGNTVDIKDGFGYNGEKRDGSGNIYLRARYYNPRIGQFIQVDSYRGEQEDPATQSRYTYVLNNQYKYVDRNGNFPILGALVIGGMLLGLTSSGPKITGAGVVGIGLLKTQKKDLDILNSPPSMRIYNNIKKTIQPKFSTQSWIGGRPPIPESCPSIEDNFAYEWKGDSVSQEFKKKVVEISKKLGVAPDDLMAVMAWESKLSHKAESPVSTATGLIQFLEGTADELGTTTSKLKDMTAVQQLDYVYAYLSTKGTLRTLGDLYMAIIWPAAVGKPDDFVLWYKTGKNSKTYRANEGLDVNDDGKITKAECVQKVIERRETYKRK